MLCALGAAPVEAQTPRERTTLIGSCIEIVRSDSTGRVVATDTTCSSGVQLVPRAAAAAARAPGIENPRGGATTLIVFESIHGLWLGLAVPAMLGAEGSEPYGLGLMLGPAAGFAFSKVVTDRHALSVGQARAIVWGGEFAAVQTVGWLASGRRSLTAKQFFGASAAGLLGGTLAGSIVARHPISGGDASLVSHSSVWGSWFGAAAASLLDIRGDYAWLIGGDIGLVGSMVATKHVEMSSSRIWEITAMGITGLAVGLGADRVIRPESDAAVTLPALLSAAGLVVGVVLTRDLDRREGRADAGPPTGALLAVRDGRLRLGIPAPLPALLPADAAGRRLVTGMRMTLFDLRH